MLLWQLQQPPILENNSVKGKAIGPQGLQILKQILECCIIPSRTEMESLATRLGSIRAKVSVGKH
jgi:hypothetical protein